MPWTADWAGSVLVIESAAAGGPAGDLAELLPLDDGVVVVLCHGTVDADPEFQPPPARMVLALDGELRDAALMLAHHSALILVTSAARFVDRGRERGRSHAAALCARLPLGEVNRMSLMAEPLVGSDAARLGLADRLVPAGSLRDEAIRAASLITEVDQV